MNHILKIVSLSICGAAMTIGATAAMAKTCPDGEASLSFVNRTNRNPMYAVIAHVGYSGGSIEGSGSSTPQARKTVPPGTTRHICIFLNTPFSLEWISNKSKQPSGSGIDHRHFISIYQAKSILPSSATKTRAVTPKYECHIRLFDAKTYLHCSNWSSSGANFPWVGTPTTHEEIK